MLTPCAVWVEGPSDRVYFTAWLKAEGLIEGIDYQMMFYGGALGAHVTARADTAGDQGRAAIRALSRYAAVVVDSDRERAHAKLKRTARRFKAELGDDEHAHLLVTWGREVENYLPRDIINTVRRKHGSPSIESEQDPRFARAISESLARRPGKVRFAEEAIELLEGEVPAAAQQQVRELARFIRNATPN